MPGFAGENHAVRLLILLNRHQIYQIFIHCGLEVPMWFLHAFLFFLLQFRGYHSLHPTPLYRALRLCEVWPVSAAPTRNHHSRAQCLRHEVPLAFVSGCNSRSLTTGLLGWIIFYNWVLHFSWSIFWITRHFLDWQKRCLNYNHIPAISIHAGVIFRVKIHKKKHFQDFQSLVVPPKYPALGVACFHQQEAFGCIRKQSKPCHLASLPSSGKAQMGWIGDEEWTDVAWSVSCSEVCSDQSVSFHQKPI